MSKYVDADEVVKTLTNNQTYSATVLQAIIDRIPKADVEPVRHGHWELATEGFFNAEENEFYVFVNAHCSVCKEKWHSDDIRSGYYDTVCDYDYNTEMPCPITDERINKCKQHWLHEAEKRIPEISPFCEKCGAKMDEEVKDE